MLRIHGTSASITREGVSSVRLRYFADSFDDIKNVQKTAKGIGGGNLSVVNIEATQAEEGKQYVVTATYEGKDGGDTSAYAQSEGVLYNWRPEVSDDPIETNPNFWEIVRRFSGYEKEPGSGDWNMWPRLKSKSGGTTENPMVGVRSFLNLGGQWSETKAVTQIPNDIWRNVWRLVSSVPGGFPTPGNRLWLVMPPEITQRGACFVVTRSWKLTGEMNEAKIELARLIYRPIT